LNEVDDAWSVRILARHLRRHRRNRTALAHAGAESRTVRRRTSTRAAQTADRVGETVATALTGMAERFRNHAGSISDEAAKFGGEAAKLGNVALRRLSNEVERRPLVTLAVAVGVGMLIGLASNRH
jgi:ElaB/YqjD/DUF883 family membrane-anchored ribosome-binding protein